METQKNIERYEPNINTGLNSEQLKKRIEQNLINYDTTVPTKSIKQILFENFFTLFNLLNLVLGIAIFCVGSYKNMLFLAIVIINTAISTIQEIHSKKVIDKLAIMATSKAKVIRNGNKQDVSIHELVLDDIIELNTGNQISTDSIIIDGQVEINESFITGEPDNIIKEKGDMLLSGSYITSGKCIAKVEHIGDNNYTAKISSGAKYVKKINSEIMASLNKIIKFLTFAIVPIGILMFFNQINIDDNTYKEAVIKTVASIIGMIPEGLVLLTSTVLAVSVIRLSKNKVLVQELYCIETLARVDTLCLDKTGTLTEGKMEVKDYISLNNSKKEIQNILSNISKYSEDENSTIDALRKYFNKIDDEFTKINCISFSSKNKWSGINFKEKGSYIIGAPEFILKNNYINYKNVIEHYSKDYRIILLAHSKNNVNINKLPENLEVLGFVLISDIIRKEACKTLEYFKNQGVNIKIISGDNPITVSKIAKQVGIEKYDNYIDMSLLSTYEEIKNAATSYTIFGRVSPTQKQNLVMALQENGKTVAMTGDGVNDVLALKAADCSIAMANGSDATKNVSQLILLDSNFASMPKVVAEGRRTINNIERSASLFLVKTIYSTILALMFLFMREEYPFIPVQLSLISIVTIGIPSFILALEPNNEKIRGNFMQNVISKAIPTALTVIINIFSIALLNSLGIIQNEFYSTLCVISTGLCGICLLFTLSRSRKSENIKLIVSPFRLILAFLMLVLFLFGLTALDWWFNISALDPILPQIIRLIIITLINYTILNILIQKVVKFKN